jgi:hypothetical protein
MRTIKNYALPAGRQELRITNYKIKLFLILVIIGGVFWANKYSWQGGDISILSINEDKVEMINVSPSRGMVNTYVIENMDLWIPNGMGWYPASRLGLIVNDDIKLAREVMFYNFGFWPKQVLRQQKWNQNKSLWSMLGPIGLIRYRLISENWLWRNDKLKLANLFEIMPRDMASNDIVSSDVKINVINASGKNGFGNMIADRLEWLGLMVTSVQTFELQKTCQIYYEYLGKETKVALMLAQIFGCETINRQGMFELILGTDIEEVIKYSQTYVRAL